MAWDWTPGTLDALSRFLRERGLCDGELRTRRIGDGHSNITQLIEEVLYPSKNILDGYESFALELTNGRIMTGIIRSETGDELALIDAAGVKQVIKQGDVDRKKKTGKSVMIQAPPTATVQ